MIGFEYLNYAKIKLENVETIAERAGLDKAILKTTIDNGLCRVPILDGESPGLLVREMLEDAADRIKNLGNRVKLVLVAHSQPGMLRRYPDFIAESLDDTCLEGREVIFLSGQPCAILHFAIQAAESFLMNASDEECVALVGIDTGCSDLKRFFFGTIMGDSVLLGIVGKNAVEHRILASHSDTQIIATNGLWSEEEDIVKFRATNPKNILNSINKCLKLANLSLDQVDWIVPHTPYNKMKEILESILKFPSENILMDYMKDTGHLNSNDSFCHYKRAVDEGRLKKGDISLLVNPGFGGVRGVTILRW